MTREHLDLCGLWRFQPDPANEGELTDYPLPAYDDRRWREVMLPVCFDTLRADLDCYEGAGWYRRTVHVPTAWPGRRVVLRFEGVNYHAAVWLNGQRLGEHRDGFLPFEFDVTDVLDFDRPNLFAVRSDNMRIAGEVPGRERGWRPFGGIQREIMLVAADPLYLDHVGITGEADGSLNVTVALHNGRSAPVDSDIVIRIADSNGAVVAELSAEITLDPGTTETLKLSDAVVDVQPWSPATPLLYTAHVDLRVGSQTVDAQAIRFGFRTVRAAGARLLLNGEPIYLTGFNRHEDSPQRDMAADSDLARSDLLAMKEAGANFVRLCHYPHHSATLDLCDELGMLAHAGAVGAHQSRVRLRRLPGNNGPAQSRKHSGGAVSGGLFDPHASAR